MLLRLYLLSSVKLSWIFLFISIIFGLGLVFGDVKGVTYLYGAGFAQLCLVSIVSKIWLWRLDRNGPFPIFYIMAYSIPGIIAYILIGQKTSFFNILPFMCFFMTWFVLWFLHYFTQGVFHGYVEEYEKEQQRTHHSEYQDFIKHSNNVIREGLR